MVTAVKTASRIGVRMGVGFAVMYLVTGSLAFGGLAAILEPICNVIVMPLHDGLWERLHARLEARERAPESAHAA